MGAAADAATAGVAVPATAEVIVPATAVVVPATAVVVPATATAAASHRVLSVCTLYREGT